MFAGLPGKWRLGSPRVAGSSTDCRAPRPERRCGVDRFGRTMLRSEVEHGPPGTTFFGPVAQMDRATVS